MKVKATKMKYLLIVTFAFVLFLSLILEGGQDAVGIFVNVIFLLIVGIIYIASYIYLTRANCLAKELRKATTRIKNDYEKDGHFLIDRYREEPIEYLFDEKNSFLKDS